MKLLLQELLRRQFRQVGGDSNATLVELKQLDVLVRLASAEDQAQRRLFARPPLVLLQPAEILCRVADYAEKAV